MAKTHPVVVTYRNGEISAENALKYLGKQIEVARSQGISTKYLQSAVDAILGMPEELSADPSSDPEWAESYRNRGE